MTPKEKAIELIKSFYPHVQWKLGQEDCLDRSKECALIAVDEIINSNPYEVSKTDMDSTIDYWEEVKKEILNLKKL